MPRQRHVTAERILAVAGVAGLLLVGLASAAMIAGVRDGNDHDEAPRTEATPDATPGPAPTPTPEPTPEPLAPAERAARRAASGVVRSRGFEPVRLRDYEPRRTLRVMLGERSDGARMAFFFLRDAYVGNDSTEPSAELRVRARRRRSVTLAYGVYAPGDRPCCPSGGPVNVRYRWTGSAVLPRDPVPPPQQRSPAYQAP